MLNEVVIDFRMPGLPHSVVKQAENTRVCELVKKPPSPTISSTRSTSSRQTHNAKNASHAGVKASSFLKESAANRGAIRKTLDIR